MTPDLAPWYTLISSNYPCLEHIFTVPKVFEPLKFYCIIASVNSLNIQGICKETLVICIDIHVTSASCETYSAVIVSIKPLSIWWTPKRKEVIDMGIPVISASYQKWYTLTQNLAVG